MMLVTLDQAKFQINVDYDVSDELIELHIQAASEAVCNYLKDAQYQFLDTSGELLTDSSGTPVDVPAVVKVATLTMIADFFKNRESASPDQVDPQFGYGYPSLTVMRLLTPLRDPAYA